MLARAASWHSWTVTGVGGSLQCSWILKKSFHFCCCQWLSLMHHMVLISSQLSQNGFAARDPFSLPILQFSSSLRICAGQRSLTLWHDISVGGSPESTSQGSKLSVGLTSLVEDWGSGALCYLPDSSCHSPAHSLRTVNKQHINPQPLFKISGCTDVSTCQILIFNFIMSCEI